VSVAASTRTAPARSPPTASGFSTTVRAPTVATYAVLATQATGTSTADLPAATIPTPSPAILRPRRPMRNTVAVPRSAVRIRWERTLSIPRRAGIARNTRQNQMAPVGWRYKTSALSTAA